VKAAPQWFCLWILDKSTKNWHRHKAESNICCTGSNARTNEELANHQGFGMLCQAPVATRNQFLGFICARLSHSHWHELE